MHKLLSAAWFPIVYIQQQTQIYWPIRDLFGCVRVPVHNIGVHSFALRVSLICMTASGALTLKRTKWTFIGAKN